MSLCIDTETAVMDAVNDSLVEVFQMMVGETLSQLSTSELSHQALHEAGSTEENLSVVVTLTGGLRGSLNICMDQSAALRWTSQLIEHETDSIDQTVVDAAGELGNMVVGGAKRRLSSFNLTMSLPTVVRAGVECLEFPSHVKPIRLDYEYSGARVAVIVALGKES